MRRRRRRRGQRGTPRRLSRTTSCRWPSAGYLCRGGRRTRRQSDLSREVTLREVARDDFPQLGLRRLADFLRIRTARMERASAGQIDRTRQFSLDLRSAALEFRIRHRDRRQERLRVRVQRLRDDFLSDPELDDPAQVHDRDPVRHVPRHPDVVGDEHEGEPDIVTELEQEIHDPCADRDVEHGHRLVRDDELRLEDDRPRDRDPLPLPAAQLVRIPVHEVGRRRKFGVLERLRDQVFSILQGIRHAVYRQRLRDRVHHGEPRVERLVGILEDHLNAASEVLQGRSLQGRDVLAVEEELALCGLLQLHQEATGRRLPTARLSDDPEDFAPLDREIDPVDGVDLFLPPSERVQQSGLQREELPEPTHVPDGAILRHARLPENISFAKWQRERWPVSTSMSSGRSRVQMSWANRQRGWKRHPVGGLTRSGGDPGIALSFFLGPFTLGNASRRPSAYGCEGRSKTLSVVPSSTISPAYMITMRSETSATTEMSCVMIIIARSSSRCKSRISPKMRSCMITSRAVVGSSAMIRSGLQASAIAIIARCFIPPENSCGYPSDRSAVMPTSLNSS